MAWQGWLPEKAPPSWQSFLLGILLGGLATGLRVVLHGPAGSDLPLVTLFPALVVASALGGFQGGLTCLVAATLGAVFVVVDPGASLPWLIGSFWIAGGLIVIATAAFADKLRELSRSEARLTETRAQLRTVVRELAHRNRNALFVIKSIVSQSSRGAASAAAAERIINDRLDALVRAQDAVALSDGERASLEVLLHKALEPFGAERFAIEPGPEVFVEADVAVGMGLLFHELATNALKHGSLTASGGTVEIDWTRRQEFAHLRWREMDGPAVMQPTKRGFGSRLFDIALVPQGGKVERRFEVAGLVCEMNVPVQPENARSRRQAANGQALVRALEEDIDDGAASATTFVNPRRRNTTTRRAKGPRHRQ